MQQQAALEHLTNPFHCEPLLGANVVWAHSHRRKNTMTTQPIPPRQAGTNQTGMKQPPGDGALGAHSGTSCPRYDRRRISPWLMVLTVIAFTVLSIAQARAETTAAFCTRVGDDTSLRPIPASLVPIVNALFGIKMSPGEAVATTVFRCVNGRVMVCTVGANLPCGPANTSRVPKPGVEDWCRESPDVAYIPAAVVGHDTIFAWQCRGGVPRIIRQIFVVDNQGFIKQFWKRVR